MSSCDLRVRLDVEPLLGQLLQLRPRQRDAGADEVRVDEERRREPELLENRVRVLLEGLPAVVERQDDRLARELLSERRELEELLERDDVVALALEVPHLLLERARGHEEPAAGLRPQVVIAEDRHQLVAARLHAREVPRPLRDHDLAARREGRRAVVVLDHPGLRRISEDSAARARPRCHPPWRARRRSVGLEALGSGSTGAGGAGRGGWAGAGRAALGRRPGRSAPGAGAPEPRWTREGPPRRRSARPPPPRVRATVSAGLLPQMPSTSPCSRRESRATGPHRVASVRIPRSAPSLPSVGSTTCFALSADVTHPASGRVPRRPRPALPCPSPGSLRASAR